MKAAFQVIIAPGALHWNMALTKPDFCGNLNGACQQWQWNIQDAYLHSLSPFRIFENSRLDLVHLPQNYDYTLIEDFYLAIL